VNSRLFWRAGLIQLVVVAIPFAVLALTVSDDFFEDWGMVSGPVVWIACSLVTGRILGFPLPFALFCAAAGGVAGALVMLVFGHHVGVVAAIAVFAASASGYPEAEPPGAAGSAADAGGASEPGDPDRVRPQSSTP
jgi:hypothetical protein